MRFQYRTCVFGVLALLLVLAPGCGEKAGGPDQDPVRSLFARMPADSAMRFVVPDPGALLEKLGTLGASGESPGIPMDAVQDIARQSGTSLPMESQEDIDAWLDGHGIDRNRPVGMALNLEAAASGLMYLPVADAALFEQAPLAAGSEALSLEVGGEAVKAGTGPEGSWFIADGYVVMAQDEIGLRRAASSFEGAPADEAVSSALASRTGGDILQLVRVAPLLDVIPPGPDGGAKAAIRDFFESVLLEFSFADLGEASEVRAVAFKRTAGGADEAPISLRHPIGPDTAISIALKDCGPLIELIAAGLNEYTGDRGPLNEILSNLAGNEVAISVDIASAGFPSAVLSARPVDSATINELLTYFLVGAAPAGEHNGVQMQLLRGDNPLYSMINYSLKDDTLIVATSAEGVRNALDRLAGDPAPTTDSPNRADVTFEVSKAFASPFASAMGAAGQLPAELATAPPMTLKVWERADSVEARFSFPMLAANTLYGQSMKAGAAATSASSQNNQKQIGLIFKMYANESHDGLFPPLMEAPGHLMFALTDAADYREGRGKELYPEYMTDTEVLVNPGAADADAWREKLYDDPPAAAESGHYVYLGYFVRNEADMAAYTEAYLAAVEGGGVPNADIEHAGQTIYRLREGIERVEMPENPGPADAARIQSEALLLMERPGVWPGGEINVMYLDGHVESVPQGEFPNTEEFWANVASINALQ